MNEAKRHEEIKKESLKMAEFIKAAYKKYKPIKKPVIIGASQGGDISCMTGIYYPELVSAVFPFLAVLDAQTMKTPIQNVESISFKIFHGKEDSVVPIELVRRQKQFLAKNGLISELFEIDNCGHQITNEMKMAYMSEIRKIL